MPESLPLVLCLYVSLTAAGGWHASWVEKDTPADRFWPDTGAPAVDIGLRADIPELGKVAGFKEVSPGEAKSACSLGYPVNGAYGIVLTDFINNYVERAVQYRRMTDFNDENEVVVCVAQLNTLVWAPRLGDKLLVLGGDCDEDCRCASCDDNGTWSRVGATYLVCVRFGPHVRESERFCFLFNIPRVNDVGEELAHTTKNVVNSSLTHTRDYGLIPYARNGEVATGGSYWKRTGRNSVLAATFKFIAVGGLPLGHVSAQRRLAMMARGYKDWSWAGNWAAPATADLADIANQDGSAHLYGITDAPPPDAVLLPPPTRSFAKLDKLLGVPESLGGSYQSVVDIGVLLSAITGDCAARGRSPVETRDFVTACFTAMALNPPRFRFVSSAVNTSAELYEMLCVLKVVCELEGEWEERPVAALQKLEETVKPYESTWFKTQLQQPWYAQTPDGAVVTRRVVERVLSKTLAKFPSPPGGWPAVAVNPDAMQWHAKLSSRMAKKVDLDMLFFVMRWNVPLVRSMTSLTEAWKQAGILGFGTCIPCLVGVAARISHHPPPLIVVQERRGKTIFYIELAKAHPSGANPHDVGLQFVVPAKRRVPLETLKMVACTAASLLSAQAVLEIADRGFMSPQRLRMLEAMNHTVGGAVGGDGAGIDLAAMLQRHGHRALVLPRTDMFMVTVAYLLSRTKLFDGIPGLVCVYMYGFGQKNIVSSRASRGNLFRDTVTGSGVLVSPIRDVVADLLGGGIAAGVVRAEVLTRSDDAALYAAQLPVTSRDIVPVPLYMAQIDELTGACSLRMSGLIEIALGVGVQLNSPLGDVVINHSSEYRAAFARPLEYGAFGVTVSGTSRGAPISWTATCRLTTHGKVSQLTSGSVRSSGVVIRVQVYNDLFKLARLLASPSPKYNPGVNSADPAVSASATNRWVSRLSGALSDGRVGASSSRQETLITFRGGLGTFSQVLQAHLLEWDELVTAGHIVVSVVPKHVYRTFIVSMTRALATIQTGAVSANARVCTSFASSADALVAQAGMNASRAVKDGMGWTGGQSRVDHKLGVQQRVAFQRATHTRGTLYGFTRPQSAAMLASLVNRSAFPVPAPSSAQTPHGYDFLLPVYQLMASPAYALSSKTLYEFFSTDLTSWLTPPPAGLPVLDLHAPVQAPSRRGSADTGDESSNCSSSSSSSSGDAQGSAVVSSDSDGASTSPSSDEDSADNPFDLGEDWLIVSDKEVAADMKRANDLLLRAARAQKRRASAAALELAAAEASSGEDDDDERSAIAYDAPVHPNGGALAGARLWHALYKKVNTGAVLPAHRPVATRIDIGRREQLSPLETQIEKSVQAALAVTGVTFTDNAESELTTLMRRLIVTPVLPPPPPPPPPAPAVPPQVDPFLTAAPRRPSFLMTELARAGQSLPFRWALHEEAPPRSERRGFVRPSLPDPPFAVTSRTLFQPRPPGLSPPPPLSAVGSKRGQMLVAAALGTPFGPPPPVSLKRARSAGSASAALVSVENPAHVAAVSRAPPALSFTAEVESDFEEDVGLDSDVDVFPGSKTESPQVPAGTVSAVAATRDAPPVIMSPSSSFQSILQPEPPSMHVRLKSKDSRKRDRAAALKLARAKKADLAAKRKAAGAVAVDAPSPAEPSLEEANADDIWR